MSIGAIHSFNKKQQEWYAKRTGILVDIEKIGQNTSLLAVREEPGLVTIHDGVWLKKEVIEFNGNHFTNVYDFFWNPDERSIFPEVHSSNTPYSLLERVEKENDIIGIINGGFFFLTDIADSTPIDLPYNFCIRDGIIFGLPSQDQPIIYTRGGKLCHYEPSAIGTMLIGKRHLQWVGANSERYTPHSQNAVLYNSKCSDVKKVRDPKTNIQIGILDNEHITTPKNPFVVDVVIAQNKRGELVVTEINPGGNTHFFRGLFILQLQKNTGEFEIGDQVVPLTLDGLNLRTISSGITIGRNLTDPYFLNPIRSERQDARSLIAEDRNGYIHFIVIDGSKYVPGFCGVSAKDIRQYFAKDMFAWAYFLDGGGSSRLIVNRKTKREILANQFVFRKVEGGKMLWDWKRGRDVTSSIVLKKIK